MRIDVVTIFPEYLAPLDAVAAGQGAAPAGCSTCTSTTCGTGPTTGTAPSTTRPYGGGAGMVMKPEPWGEALDAILADGADAGDRSSSSPPRAGCRSPRRSPRSSRRSRHLRLRLRPLRGHRPAGRRPRRHPDAGAARSRSATTSSTGARSPRWRSSRPSSGCCPGSWATPSRSARSRTARTGCWSTRSTPSPRRWRGLDVPAGAALRRPRPHRRLAPRPGGRRTAERRPDLLHPSRRLPAGLEVRRRPGGCRGAARDAARRRRAADPAARVLGRRRRSPTTCSTSPRSTSRSTTSRAELDRWTTFVAAVGGPAGRHRPRPAQRRRRLVHRPAHGGARPPGPRPGPMAARARSRRRRRTAPTRSRWSPAPAARPTSGCTAGPATAPSGSSPTRGSSRCTSADPPEPTRPRPAPWPPDAGWAGPAAVAESWVDPLPRPCRVPTPAARQAGPRRSAAHLPQGARREAREVGDPLPTGR